jgi:hypothetical protein
MLDELTRIFPVGSQRSSPHNVARARSMHNVDINPRVHIVDTSD